MKRQLFALFITTSLVGCWTASVPPAPIGQNIVHKAVAPLPTLKSNRAAVVQINYHIVDKATGIYEGPYGGIGLVVGPYTVIDVGWHSTLIPGHVVLHGITIESFSGDWSQPAFIAGRFGGKTGDEIALLKTDDALPVKPATFSRAVAGTKIKGYRFASDGIQEYFNLDKIVAVFVTPSDNTQCDIANRSNAIDDYQYNESIYDMEHHLVCYYDRPWWEVEAGLLRFGVVTLKK